MNVDFARFIIVNTIITNIVIISIIIVISVILVLLHCLCDISICHPRDSEIMRSSFRFSDRIQEMHKMFMEQTQVEFKEVCKFSIHTLIHSFLPSFLSSFECLSSLAAV